MVMPPMLPAPSPMTSGARAAAEVKASCISLTAVVRVDGVGDAWLAAYTFPRTCVDFENVFVGSAINEKPVMYDAAAGLTPRFPVMTDCGTVEIPALERIT